MWGNMPDIRASLVKILRVCGWVGLFFCGFIALFLIRFIKGPMAEIGEAVASAGGGLALGLVLLVALPFWAARRIAPAGSRRILPALAYALLVLLPLVPVGSVVAVLVIVKAWKLKHAPDGEAAAIVAPPAPEQAAPALWPRLAAAVIIGLWLSALFFPSLGTCREGQVTWFEAETTVFFGWLAAFSGLLGWYANIPLIMALFRLVRGRMPSIGLAGFALVIASTSFLEVELAHNEAWSEPLCAWGTGFWLWYSTQPLVLAVALWGWIRQRPTASTSGR